MALPVPTTHTTISNHFLLRHAPRRQYISVIALPTRQLYKHFVIARRRHPLHTHLRRPSSCFVLHIIHCRHLANHGRATGELPLRHEELQVVHWCRSLQKTPDRMHQLAPPKRSILPRQEQALQEMPRYRRF
jgi:hypothetical protein